jgi:hypothetical protein
VSIYVSVRVCVSRYANIILTTRLHHRAHFLQVYHPLFLRETRIKFRGTHLNDNEEACDYDGEGSSQIPKLAWSYGMESKRSSARHEEFESTLGSARGGFQNPETVYSSAQLDHYMTAAQRP